MFIWNWNISRNRAMAVVLDLLNDDPRKGPESRPRHPEKAHRPDQPIARKPDWIRVKAPGSAGWAETNAIIKANGLVTVINDDQLYNHANATIGRAFGLLSQNLQGGSVAGDTFMGSQGNNLTYNSVTFAENEERSPWEPLHTRKGFQPGDSVVSIFYGCRSNTFGLGLRKDHWREHVKDMLTGIDATTAPCLLLDPITARQFIDRGAFDTTEKLVHWLWDTARIPAARYWDLQLVQNYIYPRATFGEEPMATKLKAAPDELIPIFQEKDINVVVVGGETNGYWSMMGATWRKSVSVDEWR